MNGNNQSVEHDTTYHTVKMDEGSVAPRSFTQWAKSTAHTTRIISASFVEPTEAPVHGSRHYTYQIWRWWDCREGCWSYETISSCPRCCRLLRRPTEIGKCQTSDNAIQTSRNTRTTQKTEGSFSYRSVCPINIGRKRITWTLSWIVPECRAWSIASGQTLDITSNFSTMVIEWTTTKLLKWMIILTWWGGGWIPFEKL